EDVIRDRNVTGVQTCALPIWGLGLVRRLPAPGGRGQVLLPGLEGPGRRGHHPGGEARLRRSRTTDPPRTPTGPGRVLCSRARPPIGRASCRETGRRQQALRTE